MGAISQCLPRKTLCEDSEMETLLAVDSCQTQEELAESLGMAQLDAFKPSIEGETATVPRETRQLFSSMTILGHMSQNWSSYLETLKWEVLPHPPYSPDIAPSDYHFFFDRWHMAWLISISALMKKS